MEILDGKAGSDISATITKDVWTNVDMQRGHFYDEWVTKEDKADEEDEEDDDSEYQMRRMSFEWSFFCSVLSSSISYQRKQKASSIRSDSLHNKTT